MDALQIREAEIALRAADPVLSVLIQAQGPVTLTRRTDYFASLCRTIVGQQVSVKAAATIFGRFETTTGLEPVKVAALTPEQVKTIGLSRQKASYLTDLAKHFVDEPTIYDHLEKLSDVEIIAELTEVKGIGVWSAQMFLIFTLGRPDVFAPDDAGLQRAITQLYKMETAPSKADLLKLSEKWQPYRSIASLHLWKSLDNTPAE